MDLWLWAHPANPSMAVDRIDVSVDRLSDALLRLRFVLLGDTGRIVLPGAAPPGRANNLWRTTCFEAFLRPEQAGTYCELNFSPSGQWAAYDFAAYRAGMVQAALPAPPDIALTLGDGRLSLDVALSLDLPHEPYRLGLCAIVEELGGGHSYWALNHAGGPPDFHHPACFAVELPPAPRP